MHEMPTGWTTRSFSEFCRQFKRINSDGRDLEPLSVTKDSGIIRQSEKFNKRIATDTSKYKVIRRGEFAYDPMSLYYGAIGQLDCEDEGVVSPAYITFDVDKSIDRDWFRHLISSEIALRAFVANTQGGNFHGKRKKTDWSAFSAVALPTPPLAEQKKSAAILLSVDDTMRANQAVIERTRRVKEGLLQELLTRGIGHTVFTDTSSGPIPKSWSISTPGQLASFTGGNGFRKPDWSESGLPIIRIQNLNGSKRFNFYEGPVQPKWLVHPGDLLFAWAGTAGASFGPTLWPGPKAVLNQHIYKVTPYAGVNKLWLYGILRMITARIEQHAHGFKSTLLHVHKSDITDQPIPLPPESEQREISLRLQELEDVDRSSASTFDALQATKAGLLQDLLSGKVRVSP